MNVRAIGGASFVLLACIAIGSGPAFSTPAGVKGMGMAAATIAYPVDAFAGVYNPASIALLPDRLDVGAAWLQRYGRAKLRDLPDYPEEVSELYGIEPALLNMLTLDCMEDVVTFGGSWRVTPCSEVSLFYGVGMTKKLRGKNSVPREVPQPAPLDGPPYSGREALPVNSSVNDEGSDLTGERAFGEVDLKARRASLGVAWGWIF